MAAPDLEVQVSWIAPVALAERSEALAARHVVSYRHLSLPQMGILRPNVVAVGQWVLDEDDVSPRRRVVVGGDHLAVSGGVYWIAQVAVAAPEPVPILTRVPGAETVIVGLFGQPGSHVVAHPIRRPARKVEPVGRGSI
jgi:hypothetical protein